MTPEGGEWLMCPPRHFGVRYEINPWMHVGRPADPARARRQWDRLRAALDAAGGKVRLLRPRAGLPDLVFTANAGLVIGRLFVRSAFRYPQRRGEEPVVEAWFRRHGYRVARLPPGARFEGEGDALPAGDAVLLGFRFRSDAAAHERLAVWLGRRVLPVELTDPRFYHLDTCYAPLDGRTSLWFPAAFDRYARRVIEDHVPDLVAVGEADARRFACNAVAAGRTILLPSGVSRPLRRLLESRGFAVRPTPCDEFLKAGGAAKCLVLRLA